MDTTRDETSEHNEDLKTDETLPPFVAYQVEQESLDKAPSSSGAAEQHFRHGRIEAETRRVSEQVTRDAQERRRIEQASAAAVAANETSATPTVAPNFPPKTYLPKPKSMRRLLVPLDGTPLGERSLPYASAFARLLDAHLLLGHVTPTEPPAALGQMFRVTDTERQVAQQAFAPNALPYLKNIRDEMAGDTQQIDTLHITAPTVAEGLLQMAKSRDIDLVFLAIDAHEAERMKVGRVVDSLIRTGSNPVLVIPPMMDMTSHPFSLRHVLVTLDGSRLSEQALGPLGGLLEQLQQQQGEKPTVTLLAVAEDYSILPDYQSYLDALSGTLAGMPQFAGAPIHAKAIVGSAPGAIVGAIEYGVSGEERQDTPEALPVDLLMMTTHGRGGMSRWLFGSIALYVLPRVNVPVLLTRPGSPVTQ
jgi:nucleotide-binding universal stress UspA family protein